MVYLVILVILMLAWKRRLRDLIKRLLILAAIPVLHIQFLKKAEDPLVFQEWTLLALAVLAAYGVYRTVRWVRSFRS